MKNSSPKSVASLIRRYHAAGVRASAMLAEVSQTRKLTPDEQRVKRLVDQCC